MEDILIACTDNLTDFSTAIEPVFLKTVTKLYHPPAPQFDQVCILQRLEGLHGSIKAVYAAVNEPSALDGLEVFTEYWDQKYSKISSS